MLKLVVIGAGQHSQSNHLPALAYYAREHPGEIGLAGLCDLNGPLAEAMARRYGFRRAYTDLREMLRAEEPDGCIAVTPVEATASVARQIMEANVALCMEKPPGATPDEAREVAEEATNLGARVMVSVNRRFDPAIRSLREWWDGRPMEVVHGCLARINRREPHFVTDTAIHAVDALRAIVGDVEEYVVQGRRVDGVRWFLVHLWFVSGAIGTLEIMPTAGADVERYEVSGQGLRGVATSGYKDAGSTCCWEGGKLALETTSASGAPEFIRAGTYDETSAFIASLRGQRPFTPTPADVLPSLELCHAIDADFPA